MKSYESKKSGTSVQENGEDAANFGNATAAESVEPFQSQSAAAAAPCRSAAADDPLRSQSAPAAVCTFRVYREINGAIPYLPEVDYAMAKQRLRALFINDVVLDEFCSQLLSAPDTRGVAEACHKALHMDWLIKGDVCSRHFFNYIRPLFEKTVEGKFITMNYPNYYYHITHILEHCPVYKARHPEKFDAEGKPIRKARKAKR